MKYKQSSKNQKKGLNNLKSVRVSLPTLKLKYAQQTESPTYRMLRINSQYHSEKPNTIKNIPKESFNIILKPTQKDVKNENQQILNSAKANSTTKSFKSFSLSERQSSVYLSPSKKRKLDKLPEIISEGKFIKQIENSVDTSQQEDNKFKKQMFIRQKNQVEPQLWLIKKQKFQNFGNENLDEILTKKLYNGINSALDGLSSQSPEKRNKQKLSGPDAVQKFYSHYKNMDRIKQIEDLKKQVNPLTIILTILQNYNIPPKRMDIIKVKGSESILDLNQIGLGHSISIKAISDILEKLRYFKSINLSYNSISFDRVDIIIPQLKGLRKINLSHNRIGKQGVDLLASQVCVRNKNQEDSDSDDQDKLLEELNLEENNLPDSSLNILLPKLKVYQNLRILNLSKNFLGNTFALRLKQFLIDENHLDELYLHWNDITAKGMKSIFEGLTFNKNLKVLDLSWNQIGYESMTAISNFFKKNQTLLHLDISNCSISFDNTKQISESIKFNHTIIGLHYDGNHGFVDSLGFVNPIQTKQNDNDGFLRTQILSRINGVDKQINSHKYDSRQSRHRRTCWICQGWQQKIINIKKDDEDQACFIHFDFQNFNGTVMLETDGNYQIRKILPSNSVKFFITKINKKKHFMHKTAETLKKYDNFEIQQLAAPLEIKKFMIDKRQFTNVRLPEINVMQTDAITQDMFDQQYNYLLKCRPRGDNKFNGKGILDIDVENDQPPVKKKKKLRRKQRNKENDKKTRQLPAIQLYFNEGDGDWKSDTFKGRCAEFDLENSKIRKFISSPEQIRNLKSILEKNYDIFVSVYNHLSNNCVNGVTSIFHISETKLDHFIDFMKFQSKGLTKAKIRLKIITTLSLNDQFSKSQARYKDLEQRLFNRPQFFQFLLRIAISVYCKNNSKKGETQYDSLSTEQALEKMFEQLRIFERTIKHPSQWRKQHLYSYDISLVIKSYEHFIQSLYAAYTGMYQKNMNTKMEKKMLLNEFKQIFLDADLRKTRESLKDAQIAFIESKQLQIEEGNKQYGLKFNEFIEAMVRMAHVNHFKPIGTQENKIWERIQEMEHHHEIKPKQQSQFQVPLFLKFQALLKKIYSQNRQLFHSKRMNRIFQKGIFTDEIQMFMEILKQRVQESHQKYKPIVLKVLKTVKFNTMGENQKKQMEAHHFQRVHHKITLEYLVQQLKQKFKKMAEELDKNYNQYEEVSQNQADNEVIQ